ncbi:hypothetical protein GCM10023097_80540 [Streptomyces collinus]
MARRAGIHDCPKVIYAAVLSREAFRMVLFLTLLVAGIALIAIGAGVDGMLYLTSAGVLLLIADLLYLAARSVWRSPRRPAR